MDINVKRFVDIDIDYRVPSTINTVRDTVVLLSSEGSSQNVKVFSSFDEFTKDTTFNAFTETKKYAQIFFANGGIKLDVRCGIANSEAILTEIGKLPTTEIVVAYCGDYSEIKTAAQTLTSKEGTTGDITKVYGINQKILLGRTTSAEDCSTINNFAVKVGTIEGIEMTIAAYLCKINVYGVDTVRDYAFTVENFTTEQQTSIVNDDTLLGNVLDNNMNVDMELSSAIRNLGGNLTNGKDIVNQYTLIVLHQTLTDRVLSILMQKLKGNAGINAIYTTIAAELGKYMTNGYLTSDKIWTDDDKTVVYNNVTYTLIKKNTLLSLGYYITILPLTSLSDSDKAARKCPPIYVFVADSYGIRNVTINGEVI